MEFKVKTDLSALKGWVKATNEQIKQASVQAINDTAFKARKDMQAEMRAVFDRPTNYIVSSVKVEQATLTNGVATVVPTYKGGKGIEPTKVLAAEVYGGPRRLKRAEVALQRAGILPAGYFTVPGGGAKPLFDQYGNLKASFIVQLLTYFKAMGEQGYKANMSDKRKAKLANKGRSAGGFVTINGVEYFVAFGKLRGGKTEHLAPGIWSRTGVHGVDVKPILMFVKQPSYRKRLNLDAFASADLLQAQYAKNFAYRVGRLTA